MKPRTPIWTPISQWLSAWNNKFFLLFSVQPHNCPHWHIPNLNSWPPLYQRLFLKTQNWSITKVRFSTQEDYDSQLTMCSAACLNNWLCCRVHAGHQVHCLKGPSDVYDCKASTWPPSPDVAIVVWWPGSREGGERAVGGQRKHRDRKPVSRSQSPVTVYLPSTSSCSPPSLPQTTAPTALLLCIDYRRKWTAPPWVIIFWRRHTVSSDSVRAEQCRAGYGDREWGLRKMTRCSKPLCASWDY